MKPERRKTPDRRTGDRRRGDRREPPQWDLEALGLEALMIRDPYNGGSEWAILPALLGAWGLVYLAWRAASVFLK